MKLAAPWLAWPEVQKLQQAFMRAGFELRFVGGCVRDTILGRAVGEIDAASNATPDQMLELLEKAHLRAIPTGLAHGTVTALVGGRSFEITTLRKDVATDGRHAEVAFTDRWEEDAKRRDFTMNALYLAADGTLYDDVGGLADCKAGMVRFIGDANARIQEDYLRILRYFRFVATVGNNQFDEAALAACAANKQGIAQLSGERIAQELLKLLRATQAHVAMEKLLPLLSSLIGEVSGGGHYLARLEAIMPPPQPSPCGGGSALLKLAALIGVAEKIKTIAERLKLSSKQAQKLRLWLSHAPLISPDMNELSQKKLVRALGADDYRYTVQLAYALSEVEWKSFAPLMIMATWTPPAFPITARDLMEHGYKEGKTLGDTLKELEKRWEESGYVTTKEELITSLR